jgi:hypothetical protein
MLYCKVLLNKKENKINTIFVDEESNREIDPFSILNKPCSVTAAIKFESIFIGNKISLQVKLYEVVVRQTSQNSMRGLLRPNAQKYTSSQAVDFISSTVGKPVEVNIYNNLGIEEDSEDDENVHRKSDVSDESEESDDDDIVTESNKIEIPVEINKDTPKKVVGRGKKA